MKKLFKSLSLMTLGIVFSVILFAANKPDFNVIASNGDVMVKREKANDWAKLSQGDKLFAEDQVKIGNGSYLGLIHSNGATIEQKNSGTYSVKKLISQATAQKSDVTKKFTKYILNELANNDDMTAGGDYRKNMSKTGAVERSLGTATSKGSGIEARLPRSSYLIDNKVEFSWYKIDNAKEYTFIITDPDNKQICSKKVTGNEITINLDDLKLRKGECYNWHVQVNNKKSDDYCIYRMPDEDMKALNTDLNQIKSEMGADNSAIGKLVLASFYEEKNIMNRAVQSYEEAIKAEPNVASYKKMYGQFLNRIGLTTEAKNYLK